MLDHSFLINLCCKLFESTDSKKKLFEDRQMCLLYKLFGAIFPVRPASLAS